MEFCEDKVHSIVTHPPPHPRPVNSGKHELPMYDWISPQLRRGILQIIDVGAFLSKCETHFLFQSVSPVSDVEIIMITKTIFVSQKLEDGEEGGELGRQEPDNR